MENKEFILSKEKIMNKIESVEYYMKITEQGIRGLLDGYADQIISVALEAKPELKSEISNIEHNSNKLKLLIQVFNKEKEALVENVSEDTEREHYLSELMTSSVNVINQEFFQPQEAIHLSSIRNSSIFVYLFSIYESTLKEHSTSKMKNIKPIIDDYIEKNSNDPNWRNWGHNTHKQRQLRNEIVHTDIQLEVNNKHIKDLIENIKLFIQLYSEVVIKLNS